MSLGFSPEYEQKLSDILARGHFASQADALQYAIDLLAADQSAAHPPLTQDPMQWAKEFRAWAENHPHTDHDVDVSRESIYAERGL